MKCQFFVTVCILWLPHQIRCKPLSDLVPVDDWYDDDYRQDEWSDDDHLGEDLNNSHLGTPEEQSQGSKHIGGKPTSENAGLDQQEKPNLQKEIEKYHSTKLAEEEEKTTMSAPIPKQKPLSYPAKYIVAEEEEKTTVSAPIPKQKPLSYPAKYIVAEKEEKITLSAPIPKQKPLSYPAKYIDKKDPTNQPKETGKGTKEPVTAAVGLSNETSSRTSEEKSPPEVPQKGSSPAVVQDPVSSPKEPEVVKPVLKKPEMRPKSVVEDPKKKLARSPYNTQAVSDQKLISVNRKNKADLMTAAFHQEIDSILEAKKKSRQLKRSASSAQAIPLKDVTYKPEKKPLRIKSEKQLSLKPAEKTKQLKSIQPVSQLSNKYSGRIGFSSPPRQEKLYSGSRYLPVLKRGMEDEPKVEPSKEKSGTEDYEAFMARRAKQLDELEKEQPKVSEKKPKMTVKNLPSRRTTITGSFESIVNLLQENRKSSNAGNKDQNSRDLPKLNQKVFFAGAEDLKPRAEGCDCSSKYSAFNVVRRTAKNVVRVLRTGTNAVYDGVDSVIVKSKDIKDAFKNDVVDPTVSILPVVGPMVGGVIDAGDMVVDEGINTARYVVQGGKQLNDGLFTGAENMFKKDKSCPCTRLPLTE